MERRSDWWQQGQELTFDLEGHVSPQGLLGCSHKAASVATYSQSQHALCHCPPPFAGPWVQVIKGADLCDKKSLFFSLPFVSFLPLELVSKHTSFLSWFVIQPHVLSAVVGLGPHHCLRAQYHVKVMGLHCCETAAWVGFS